MANSMLEPRSMPYMSIFNLFYAWQTVVSTYKPIDMDRLDSHLWYTYPIADRAGNVLRNQ